MEDVLRAVMSPEAAGFFMAFAWQFGMPSYAELRNHVTKLLLEDLEPPPGAPMDIDWPELVPS